MKNIALIIALLLLTAATSFSQEKAPNTNEWPRKIEAEKGTVVIYQPQVENFSGNKLEARAAVSVTTKESNIPVFGAMWLDCRVSTDRDERTVALLDVTISAAKFPDMEEERIKKISSFLEAEIPKWNLVMSLDGLLAGMEAAKEQDQLADQFNNAPPEIIFTTTSSVLISIDGEPVLKETDENNYKYVVNTPYFIVQDVKNNINYLKGGNYWYSSASITEGWKNIEKPPKKVAQLAEQAMPEQDEGKGEEDEKVEGVIQEIIVRTKPAELLQSNGEPDYTSVEGTSLLFMSNTDAAILMDINTQLYYVLISGRWYSSTSLTDNNWAFVKPDDVPKEFSDIPAESDMGDVRASVAGTQEAKEAILNNQIPQTAAIDRKEAKLTVDYDGRPKFEKIEGTNIKYATNTDKSVLEIDETYYCCDNATWFQSSSPLGPWVVSVQIPDDIQNIPPDNPNYNVKYVYIYDSTPEVVYVGYTPGYTYSYAYGGCVYYGTGWYYTPWYGAYYYPRPVTYGFGVRWNPYSGWGFTFGVSYGSPYAWYSFGWHSPYRGWWGPSGYRHGYHHGYRHGYNRGYYSGARAGYYAGQRDAATNNIYNNRSNGVRRTGGSNYNPRTGERTKHATPTTRQAQTPGTANRANNVYSDRNGNVYKRDGDNWQKRESGQWKDAGKTTDRTAGGKVSDRSQTGSKTKPSQSVNRSQQQQTIQNLNKDYNSRNRSSQRSSQYNSNRQNYQYSKPSSGSINRSAGSRPSGTRSGGTRRR